jgi:hypothetical protein
MSKYNLTDIHKGIIKESMSRGGTVNDSFYSIANVADELEGQNLGKDTYPIEVKRLGPSGDEKTTEEIVVRYGEGHKDYFSIYDYKFEEDPTSEENYQTEYPFSLGIPTGNNDGKEWAAKLGFKIEGMNETTKKNIKEEEGFTEVSTKEIRFHLDAYKAGNINGDDLAQAIEEIVFGETRAPGTMEEAAIKEPIELQDALERYSFGEILDTAAEFYTENGEKDVAVLAQQSASKFRKMLDDLDGLEEETDRPGYHKDGTPKSNDEMSDDEREEFYLNLDSVDEDLKAHFARFK